MLIGSVSSRFLGAEQTAEHNVLWENWNLKFVRKQGTFQLNNAETWGLNNQHYQDTKRSLQNVSSNKWKQLAPSSK